MLSKITGWMRLAVGLRYFDGGLCVKSQKSRGPHSNQSLALNPTNTDEVIQLFRTLKSTTLLDWLHSNL